MARPDIFLAQTRVDAAPFGLERSASDRMSAVIQTYFNHPSLHGYSRMKDWPEYYNHHTEKFESLLAGFIGDTYYPGEIMISSRAQIIRLIQRFQEDSEVWRWEGMTLSRDQKGAYYGEVVNRYYTYPQSGEAVLVPRPLIRFPLRPQQILDEAMNVYDTFRIRYDLVT